MQNFNFIPCVKSYNKQEGAFKLSPKAKIIARGVEVLTVAELLADYLRPSTGYSLPVVTDCTDSGSIILQANNEIISDDAGFSVEQYTIEVNEKNIILLAENTVGLVRAVQTLRQMFRPEIYSLHKESCLWEIACGKVFDKPAFRWRGVHLDVARHFFSVAEVCRIIELAAQHRLNVFHFHLTDDQGWRIEIKKYPKLTEVGSIRRCTMLNHLSDKPRTFDNKPYGGFYTQSEIKEIVAFATRRHINIVPEIDMPGHMQAAITAYPEWGNHPTWQHELRTIWGVSYHILNSKDTTLQAMKDILSEIMELFPSRFIHIGGDEALKYEWEQSYEIQEHMTQLGLKSEDELQTWFINEMNQFICSRSRRMIGWDEILHTRLDPETSIMSWRSEEATTQACMQNLNAVSCYNEFTYLDCSQADPKHEPIAICGDLACEKVYRFDPIPKALSPEKRSLVLGGQGQLWTEYISNIKHLEYMAFPRLLALAERLWSYNSEINFADFKIRLDSHRKRLSLQHVNAHPLP